VAVINGSRGEQVSSTDECERVERRPAARERSAVHVQRLVRAAAQDKERAWGALVQEFNGLVDSVARAHRLDDADAAEVAQTAWVLMFDYLRERPEPGLLGSWLATTARQECLRILWADDHRFGARDGWVAKPEEVADPGPGSSAAERILTTVLFTDIVGSTERAVHLGDRQWRELLDAHDAVVRRELARWRGREIRTTGDGFLATFDCPARAVQCAAAITAAVTPLGIRVRAGVHTGECELVRHEIGGIAVHIAARIAALAQGDEVLVSTTVTELVRGSGLRFVDRGAYALKGIPDEWRLHALER
jgi:class 3 adenylate cyclase